MHCRHLLSFLLLPLFVIRSPAQLFSAPEPQTASINGSVTDIDGGLIPGATIIANGPNSGQHTSTTSDDTGTFQLRNLRPAVPYRIVVSARGFAPATSAQIILTPGQQLQLPAFKLVVAAVETSITAESQEQIATEQVHEAEKQRILGVIPNFYVVYDKQFVPLTPKLKFELALRSSTDVVTIAGTAFLAGVNQAANTPDYQQGWKGYGQRFGAIYAGGVSDVLIGGAILPSVLHQDPRYFYQGTGTKKSRFFHALEAPFVAKGDNGEWQPNYSSIGGDLASGALSVTYLPQSNRDASDVLTGIVTTTAGRIVNAMAEEFLLNRFTSKTNKAP
ncbi:carboxypeptidase-like regulatory domain-containing protein [Granulicella aggregans]|uniref:carboxypeptidase-like regulatory domain-containing protein n=1 Tax=Granulicella aggregans TaxID=474949 RepID=UPI0021E05FB4|nr:carboxypeptidase-like regulatory domain-containing protein [Granulicella aggregans]